MSEMITGWTPAHEAAKSGNPYALSVLKEFGVDFGRGDASHEYGNVSVKHTLNLFLKEIWRERDD